MNSTAYWKKSTTNLIDNNNKWGASAPFSFVVNDGKENLIDEFTLDETVIRKLDELSTIRREQYRESGE